MGPQGGGANRGLVNPDDSSKRLKIEAGTLL